MHVLRNMSTCIVSKVPSLVINGTKIYFKGYTRKYLENFTLNF